MQSTVDDFGHGAELPWTADFDDVVDRALQLLPAAQRFAADTRLNGVFSMTADNQPLLGAAADLPGLWVAQALRVTHAAGTARCLVAAMTGAEPPDSGLDALRPDRFAGQPEQDLRERALRLYRDISATG